MKIGGTPPGGDNFRIPEPDGSDPKKTGGPGKAGFEDKLKGTGDADSKAMSGAGKTDGPQTAKLREVVGKVDTGDPAAVDEATGKMVDWVLTERFGEGILKAPDADELRASVKEQLLADPGGSSLIKQILDKM